MIQEKKGREGFCMEFCGCKVCQDKLCAHKVPIFATLSEEELLKIVEKIVHKSYDKGDIIFLEGSRVKTLSIINQGQVKLFKHTKEGKEQILHILSEGDFFAELSLFEEEELPFSVEAMTPVYLCTLHKQDLDIILKKHPEIAIKILQVVGKRLAKVENRIQNMATNNVDARIIDLLFELKDKHGIKKKNYIEIALPLTREEMANYIGVTRETISRKLSKFQQEGWIEIVGNKKIYLLDEEKLKNVIQYF